MHKEYRREKQYTESEIEACLIGFTIGFLSILSGVAGLCLSNGMAGRTLSSLFIILGCYVCYYQWQWRRP